jgi:hypothetical protein
MSAEHVFGIPHASLGASCTVTSFDPSFTVTSLPPSLSDPSGNPVSSEPPQPKAKNKKASFRMA